MRPIRVAVLATTVHFGGIERVLLMLLRHMDADIELVPVLFTRTDTEQRAFFDSVESLGTAPHTLYVNTSRAKYANPVRNIKETMAIFRNERFDLIHSHGYRADLISLVVARWFRLPVVSTCHGFIANDLHLSFYNRLNVFLLRFFSRVIAVSDRMKADLISGGVNDARIDVVTNAVESVTETNRDRWRRDVRCRLGIGSDDFVFGYVGRLSEEKGLTHLVDAANVAFVGGRPCRILIVGEGTQQRALELQVEAHGLRDRVCFAGFQSEPSMWYPAMDAFVLPSLTEGTPMALLEAMAEGLPIVATEVGGVPAIISNMVNGILVPPSDPVRLADAMRSVATDEGLRRRLSECAVRSVRETYDVRTWIRRTREVYLTALEGRRSPA